MENAVTAISLNNTTLVTTSTGVKDADDSVTGYCVRFWENGKIVRIIRDHYASIRCCAAIHTNNPSPYEYAGNASGFVTGGNDGKMMVYNSVGNRLLSCETSPNVCYHYLLTIGRGKVSIYHAS